jgi:formyl-CoA transferase
MTANLPLDGIKILDFTQVMLGPCATQMLADLGADVIKIERPKYGDLSRSAIEHDYSDGDNPVYCSLNRNKRSITINVRKPEGQAIVHEMAKTADVVVNNFRPGVMDRNNIGYEKLSKINPGIIYGFGSGFGSSGPNVHKGGQDVLAQAMTGTMARKADPGHPLAIYPTALCDYSAGMHLVQGIMAALLQRHKTGRGQKVEVSLYDSMIAMQMQEAATHMYSGFELNWAAMPLSGAFETTDGALVMIGAFKANPLQDICKALGVDDLSVKYPELEIQRANRDYLQSVFAENFANNTTEYWIGKLEEQDLLCAPIKDLPTALEDPQTIHNQMITEIDYVNGRKMKLVASPIHMSDAPFSVRHAPPLLGQQTDEILAEAGYDTDRIAALRAEGIVG